MQNDILQGEGQNGKHLLLVRAVLQDLAQLCSQRAYAAPGVPASQLQPPARVDMDVLASRQIYCFLPNFRLLLSQSDQSQYLTTL